MPDSKKASRASSQTRPSATSTKSKTSAKGSDVGKRSSKTEAKNRNSKASKSGDRKGSRATKSDIKRSKDADGSKTGESSDIQGSDSERKPSQSSVGSKKSMISSNGLESEEGAESPSEYVEDFEGDEYPEEGEGEEDMLPSLDACEVSKKGKTEDSGAPSCDPEACSEIRALAHKYAEFAKEQEDNTQQWIRENILQPPGGSSGSQMQGQGMRPSQQGSAGPGMQGLGQRQGSQWQQGQGSQAQQGQRSLGQQGQGSQAQQGQGPQGQGGPGQIPKGRGSQGQGPPGQGRQSQGVLGLTPPGQGPPCQGPPGQGRQSQGVLGLTPPGQGSRMVNFQQPMQSFDEQDPDVPPDFYYGYYRPQPCSGGSTVCTDEASTRPLWEETEFPVVTHPFSSCGPPRKIVIPFTYELLPLQQRPDRPQSMQDQQFQGQPPDGSQLRPPPRVQFPPEQSVPGGQYQQNYGSHLPGQGQSQLQGAYPPDHNQQRLSQGRYPSGQTQSFSQQGQYPPGQRSYQNQYPPGPSQYPRQDSRQTQSQYPSQQGEYFPGQSQQMSTQSQQMRPQGQIQQRKSQSGVSQRQYPPGQSQQSSQFAQNPPGQGRHMSQQGQYPQGQNQFRTSQGPRASILVRPTQGQYPSGQNSVYTNQGQSIYQQGQNLPGENKRRLSQRQYPPGQGPQPFQQGQYSPSPQNQYPPGQGGYPPRRRSTFSGQIPAANQGGTPYTEEYLDPQHNNVYHSYSVMQVVKNSYEKHPSTEGDTSKIASCPVIDVISSSVKSQPSMQEEHPREPANQRLNINPECNQNSMAQRDMQSSLPEPYQKEGSLPCGTQLEPRITIIHHKYYDASQVHQGSVLAYSTLTPQGLRSIDPGRESEAPGSVTGQVPNQPAAPQCIPVGNSVPCGRGADTGICPSGSWRGDKCMRDEPRTTEMATPTDTNQRASSHLAATIPQQLEKGNPENPDLNASLGGSSVIPKGTSVVQPSIHEEREVPVFTFRSPLCSALCRGTSSRRRCTIAPGAQMSIDLASKYVTGYPPRRGYQCPKAPYVSSNRCLERMNVLPEAKAKAWMDTIQRPWYTQSFQKLPRSIMEFDVTSRRRSSSLSRSLNRAGSQDRKHTVPAQASKGSVVDTCGGGSGTSTLSSVSGCVVPSVTQSVSQSMSQIISQSSIQSNSRNTSRNSFISGEHRRSGPNGQNPAQSWGSRTSVERNGSGYGKL